MVKIENWFSNLPWIDYPDSNIKKYCLNKTEEYDLYNKLLEWKENGVVIFENAIDLKELDDFLNDLDFLISNPQKFEIEVDHAGGRFKISDFSEIELRSNDRLKFCNIHSISSAARRLCLSKTVVSFLNHIFLDKTAVIQTLSFNKGSQQPAHADFAFVFNQTNISFMAASWIPLEDIHEDSGPLAYYPGTHKVGEFGFYDFGNGEIILKNDIKNMSAMEFGNWLYKRINEGKYEKKVFLPKKGDVLIWHAALVHEGLPIKSVELTRKSFVTHYTSLNKVHEDNLVRDLYGKIEEFPLNGGTFVKHRWIDYTKQIENLRI